MVSQQWLDRLGIAGGGQVDEAVHRYTDAIEMNARIGARPFLALTGDLDTGSPADGVRAIEQALGATYEAIGAGDRFRSILYPEVGHAYTPEMRSEMLAWFGRWLRPQAAVEPESNRPAR